MCGTCLCACALQYRVRAVHAHTCALVECISVRHTPARPVIGCRDTRILVQMPCFNPAQLDFAKGSGLRCHASGLGWSQCSKAQHSTLTHHTKVQSTMTSYMYVKPSHRLWWDTTVVDVLGLPVTPSAHAFTPKRPGGQAAGQCCALDEWYLGVSLSSSAWFDWVVALRWVWFSYGH